MNMDYTPKINLLDYKDSEQIERGRRRREILLYLLVIILLLGAAAGIYYYQETRLAALLEDNQALTLERQQLAAQAVPEGRVYVGGTERQKALDKLIEKRVSYIGPLENVYWQAQPDIYLNTVEAHQDQLSIIGYVQGQQGFIEFSQRMLAAPGVKGVKSVDFHLNDKNGEVTFKLILDWEVKA